MCKPAENKHQTCANCDHARKPEAAEPCAACIHDEYVKGLPAFGKWTAPGLKEAKA